MKEFELVLVLYLSAALLCRQDLILAKIVSQPPIQYVYKNDSTMLNCLNITENGTFINHIRQSVWYRVYPNGSILITARYIDSSPIFVHMYALVFNAVKESDQGQYKCCTPDKRSCSVPTTVNIAEDPIVEVASLDYTAFVGSNITLACKIIYVGKPPAKFYWRRHGEYVSNGSIYSNSTYTLLLLTNLAEEDSGLYRCASDAVLSFYTYSIYLHLQVRPKLVMYGPNLAISGSIVLINCTQLEGRPPADLYITTPQGVVIPDYKISIIATVNDTGNYTCTANTSLISITEEHYLLVYDVDNTTSFLIFLVILRNSDCDTVKEMNFANEVSFALEDYIYDHICKCNVSVIPTRFTCSSNTKAIFSVQIVGYMARNVQQFLYLYHLTTQLDLQIAILYVCDHFCEDTTDTVGANSENTTISGSTHDEDNTIAIALASCSLVLLAMSMLIVLLYSTSKSIRKHCDCISREETSVPHRNSQDLIPGVTNPNIADNKLPNVQMECEQNAVTYTDNPMYESLAGSHTFKEQILTTMPVEAKRNEEYPVSNMTRNADTLHAYLDGSTQNAPFRIHYTDMSSISNEHDAAKHLYDTLSPDIETSTTSHQIATRHVQDNNHIVTEDLQAATKNVTLHMAKPLPSCKMCAEILNAKPHETDV